MNMMLNVHVQCWNPKMGGTAQKEVWDSSSFRWWYRFIRMSQLDFSIVRLYFIVYNFYFLFLAIWVHHQRWLCPMLFSFYIKGEWLLNFKPNLTKIRPFYLGSVETVDVPMLTITGQFRTWPMKYARSLELPHKMNFFNNFLM